jgi:hypothetical protein
MFPTFDIGIYARIVVHGPSSITHGTESASDVPSRENFFSGVGGDLRADRDFLDCETRWVKGFL